MGTYLTLEDAELVLLDGKASPKVQKEIEGAKLRLATINKYSSLPPTAASLIADIIKQAKEGGKLGMRYVSIPQCCVCQNEIEYYVYARSSRSRYGHKKGQKNYDSPKLIPAIDLADNFITFQNRVSLGCCRECWDKYIKTVLEQELQTVPVEVPTNLFGKPTAWYKSPNKVCTACNAEFHEREMGRRSTLMGDGHYFAKCPKCPAENLLFSRQIKDRDGFVMVPNKGN